MSRARRLIVISAPSGAGKTTLCQRLLRDFPELELSISSTTRAPRGQESHGKDYYFVSRDEFEHGIREGRFAEWARVHDHFYGTPRETVDRAFARGKSVLLDIDVQGAESLRKAYTKESFTVFIAPPDMNTLEQRLRARGTESEEALSKRIRNARTEMEQADRFDLRIVNDELERAYRELKAAVAAILAARDENSTDSSDEQT